MKARLVASARVAEETAAFTFEVEAPFTFDAGQTCDLTIRSPRYQDEKGSSRTFSIASPPAEAPRITVATRLTGSAFKRSLLEAPVGCEIELDGPSGSFGLHRNTAKPAVFFAGGIGITPFRSIVGDATIRRVPHRMTLFYLEPDTGEHGVPARPRGVAAPERESSADRDDRGSLDAPAVGLRRRPDRRRLHPGPPHRVVRGDLVPGGASRVRQGDACGARRNRRGSGRPSHRGIRRLLIGCGEAERRPGA